MLFIFIEAIKWNMWRRLTDTPISIWIIMGRWNLTNSDGRFCVCWNCHWNEIWNNLIIIVQWCVSFKSPLSRILVVCYLLSLLSFVIHTLVQRLTLSKTLFHVITLNPYEHRSACSHTEINSSELACCKDAHTNLLLRINVLIENNVRLKDK